MRGRLPIRDPHTSRTNEGMSRREPWVDDLGFFAWMNRDSRASKGGGGALRRFGIGSEGLSQNAGEFGVALDEFCRATSPFKSRTLHADFAAAYSKREIDDKFRSDADARSALWDYARETRGLLERRPSR